MVYLSRHPLTWRAPSYSLCMRSVGKAATRGESNTKVRMTPEERRELTRVQREVVWNLQRDYVVTVVGPEDEPVPYKRQGNPAVNTPQCVRRRQALRKKPLIQVALSSSQ